MNKRSIFVFLIVFMALSILHASNPVIIHNEMEPIVKGEKAHFELNLMALTEDLYEARLFYRAEGEVDFSSRAMQDEGFNLFTDIPTVQLPPGNVEYYFAMQTLNGQVFTYPEYSPEQNPLSFKLVASYETIMLQTEEEIIILSPEENELVPQDELLIAISIPNPDADVDHARSRFLIDGINVSTLLERDGNVYILVPQRIRTGSHNAEFKIFDPSGNVIGKKEWSFRVTSGSEDDEGFQQKTNVYLDNRYQNISKNNDNFFRAGVNWDAAYNNWDFRIRATGSSDDGYSGQSSNRFGTLVAYNFSPETRLYLKGGDFSGDYDQLTFWNRRIFGIGFGLNSPWFDLNISTGQTSKAIEGTIAGTDTLPGVYKETFLAVRPVFNFGKHVSWGLNLLNAKEDPKSIKYGVNARESLVLGSTLKLNFDNNRIRFAGSFQASIANSDAANKVEFDSLADYLDLTGSDLDQAQKFVDILESTGFLTISQGLAPIPSLAMQFDTYLSYFNNYIKLTFKNIDPDYVTPGNPYLLRGLRGFFFNDNIRLIDNQVFLNLYFKSYTDNLSQEDAETDNSDLGASISYFPLQKLPSLTLTYGTQSRKNDADLDNKALSPEDNSTQRVSVSTNYSFNTGAVVNTATVSVSNIVRDDKITREFINSVDSSITRFSNNSEFTVLSLAVKNKFEFPLTSRFGFSQSTSLLGESADNESNNEITRFYGGLEYNISKLFADFDFKPFTNFSISQINNDLLVSEYNRMNLTAGFLLSSFDYGNFSVRFDYVDFGDRPDTDWQDTIISTRYDVTF